MAEPRQNSPSVPESLAGTIQLEMALTPALFRRTGEGVPVSVPGKGEPNGEPEKCTEEGENTHEDIDVIGLFALLERCQ
jgi:hypothetical protein